MSKKDYIAIANAINAVMWEDKADPATVTSLVTRFAAIFAKDNPRFDAQRFFAACTASPSTK